MTTIMTRPSIHDLVKEAMEGTASKLNIELEAQRQLENLGMEQTKQAEAVVLETVSTEYVEKLAGALGFLSQQAEAGTLEKFIKESSGVGTGQGPGALTTLTPTAGGESLQPGQSGKASAKHQPEASTSASARAGDPPTGLKTNIDVRHAEQPVDPMGNKTAAALEEKNLIALGIKIAGGAPGKLRSAVEKAIESGGKHVSDWIDKDTGKKALMVGGGVAAGTAGAAALVHHHNKKKEAEDNSLFNKNLQVLGLDKVAVDPHGGENDGNLRSSAAAVKPPAGAAPAGVGVPSEPGDVGKQKRLIASNEAAINYTKGQAKSDPKSDAAKVLTEPPLSSAHDSVLQQAFTHTGQAGVKIAEAVPMAQSLTRTAAAQALLSKLAEAACADKDAKDKKSKEKDSAMPGLASPSGQSGFTAASLGS